MSMKQITMGNIAVVYHPDEKDTAELIAAACERAIELSKKNWGLESPVECRIFVMTSWLGFVFQSAPWSWKILLGATIPFWAFRARRMWPYSAAWTQKYGRKVAIGVKPPHLLEQSDRSIGTRILVKEEDMTVNVQNVTCHELVHACSAHLRLPAWLNEGIAVFTVDQFSGKQTIRQDTLELVRDFLPKAPPPTYRRLSRMAGDAIAYHGVRGYWLVRYLEERHPGFLRKMFSFPRDAKTIEREMASELKLAAETFWKDIDGVMVEYFEKRGGG